MTTNRYSEYSDCTADWFSSLPSHWEKKRLRNVTDIVKIIAGSTGHDVLSITQKGIKVKDLDSNEGQLSMDYSKYQIVEKGDFAMNHMDLLTGYIDIAMQSGVTSPDYRVFRAKKDAHLHPRFLLRVLQNAYTQKIFYAYGQGSSQLGRWRLPTDSFKDFEIPLPPAEEQKLISDFLDRETAKINALIAEQERLIELLQEKRQAVISHAVTKGLNPDAPTKDSGVEWLGEVPRHWETGQIRRFSVSVKTGRTPGESDFGESEECVPWYTPANFSTDLSPREAVKFIHPAKEKEGKAVFYSDRAVLVVGIGTIGKAAFPGKECSSNQQINAIEPSERLEPEFLGLCLIASLEQMRTISNASTIGIMNQNKTKSVIIACPPLAEQKEIARKVLRDTENLKELSKKSEVAIKLLQERRSALISAAVTGQIDVRGLVTEEEVA